MKRFLISLIALSSCVAFAQEAPEQTGTQALLEVANGKKASVYLKNMEEGSITFEPRNSPNAMTVTVDKIKSLKFSMNKAEFDAFRAQNIVSSEEISEIFATPKLGNAEKLELIFEAILHNIAEISFQGDYANYISAIEPYMLERAQYMSIENNLEEFYIMLMESYFKLGQFPDAKKCVTTLLASNNEAHIQTAKVIKGLIAISENDIATADAIRGELSSEAAALYLKASIQRIQGMPKDAIKTVCAIIADHANDTDWAPRAEMLSAYLYLDMTGTNSIISTNSVINTSRQVKNIYAGSAVAGEASKLWASLGGEAIEEAENIRKAEMAEAARIAKEERLARQEELRKEKIAARAAAKAAAEAAAATNLNTTAESQSE